MSPAGKSVLSNQLIATDWGSGVRVGVLLFWRGGASLVEKSFDHLPGLTHICTALQLGLEGAHEFAHIRHA